MIKKEREKSIAKALSIPHWKDGKIIPPSKERHDNVQLQVFQCVIYCSCLPANEAEARISSSDLRWWGGLLPWPKISLMVWLCLTSRKCGICG